MQAPQVTELRQVGHGRPCPWPDWEWPNSTCLADPI